jgi:hypothetical protein
VTAVRTDPARIVQGGRAKAFRPLPDSERRAAIGEGFTAWARGDFFEAHELLEPAWMGTRDLAERDAIQGVIKLAAAYVHAIRGNPRGVAKNLAGGRERLERSLATTAPGRTPVEGVDLRWLVGAIDERLAILANLGPDVSAGSAELLALVPPPSLEPSR